MGSRRRGRARRTRPVVDVALPNVCRCGERVPSLPGLPDDREFCSVWCRTHVFVKPPDLPPLWVDERGVS